MVGERCVIAALSSPCEGTFEAVVMEYRQKNWGGGKNAEKRELIYIKLIWSAYNYMSSCSAELHKQTRERIPSRSEPFVNNAGSIYCPSPNSVPLLLYFITSTPHPDRTFLLAFELSNEPRILMGLDSKIYFSRSVAIGGATKWDVSSPDPFLVEYIGFLERFHLLMKIEMPDVRYPSSGKKEEMKCYF
ncbi:hypothetical protein AVEN_244510-1 [Araneus ventricosus]|uniref:Uncharacterized protein n=1 Tax=Araneus ventricosus TaxID=182803 RepID=A0A4Y2F257_ARAVE|nr:hypothetical protein AVEN_244510-1 [Araneus ventricosus]